MNENMTPQDTGEIVTTVIPENKESRIKRLIHTPILVILMYFPKLFVREMRHYKTFFSDPVQYFKEFKPRKNILTDFISGIANLAIVAFCLLIGTLSISFRNLYYSIWGNNEMGFWNTTLPKYTARIIGLLIIIWAALLVLNLLYNKHIKEKEMRDKVVYSLGLLVKTAIPILIGIFIWYIIEMCTPEWFDPDTSNWSNPHTDSWEDSHPYIAFFMMGIWLPMLIYNLITNEKNIELKSKIYKENRRFSYIKYLLRKIIYNLRLTFRTGLPMAFGFSLLLLIVVLNPTDWSIYRIAIVFMIIIHGFLVWQMVIFGSQIYATSGKKRMAFILPLLIFIGFIVAEKLIAIHYNDVIWQDPTILSMIRNWIFKV